MRRGPSPLDRRRRVRGRSRSPREAKPKRSHACVANPLRVDRRRPHQNQGSPFESGVGPSPEACEPKRTSFARGCSIGLIDCENSRRLLSGATVDLPTRRLLRAIGLRCPRDHRHRLHLGVHVRREYAGASDDSAAALFGDSAVSRQGWQPVRGKTRSRGFSAASSPARRATPTLFAVRGAQHPIVSETAR